VNPVLKFVLNDVGAIPNPTAPDPNPPRKPFWNVLPVNVGLKTPVVVVVGKTKFGVGIVPTNGVRMPVIAESALEKSEGLALAKSVLVVGKPCNAAKRLAGVVAVVVPPVVVESGAKRAV
jgi:hypothetical protein